MTDVYNGLRNNHPGPPGGYFGNALVVDVTDGSTTTLALPERVLRDQRGRELVVGPGFERGVTGSRAIEQRGRPCRLPDRTQQDDADRHHRRAAD